MDELSRHRARVVALVSGLALLLGGGGGLLPGPARAAAITAPAPARLPTPVASNRFDPRTDVTSAIAPPASGPAPAAKPAARPAPTSRPPVRAATSFPMQPGQLPLQSGQAAHFQGSDGRLEVDVPAGSVTGADLAAAGGPLQLRVTQVAEPSGASGGGSGHVFLGTYLLQVVDGQGRTVRGGLRQPVTVRFHPDAPAGAIDLAHTTVTLDGTLPGDAELAPAGAARMAIAPATGAGAQTTQVATLDPASGTLTTTAALTTATTSVALAATSPVAAFGTVNPFAAGPSSGSLTASNPLGVPAGPGGLTPPLALSYNSTLVGDQHNPMAAAGWVGEGWDLSLGAISWKEDLTAQYWASSWQIQDPFGVSDDLVPPNVSVSTYYDDRNGSSITSSPIQWHTATESHARIYSYVGPLSLPGMSTHPPCFRVFEPSGLMEEYGCTQDSLQFYPSSGKDFVSQWLLDLVTDPHGNQIHITYQQDMATSNSVRYPRDAVLSAVEWDSPTCSGAQAAQTACSSSGTAPNLWAPQMRVSFQAGHSVSRFTGTATVSNKNGCNALPMRCDDPWYTNPPLQQHTFVLNDALVQVRGTGSGSWSTLRDYQMTYEQTGVAQFQDPWTGGFTQAAGKLNLTQVREVGADGSTALPTRTYTYTSLTEQYTDMDFPANPGPNVTFPSTGGVNQSLVNCGPSWNWFDYMLIYWTTDVNGASWPIYDCALWSQSYAGNSSYLASVSNGLGLAQTFTWANAHSNLDGVVTVNGRTDVGDPLWCNGHEGTFPCGDDSWNQEWSRAVLTSQTSSLVRPSSAGNQTVTSTTAYRYRLTTPVPAQPACSSNGRCFDATMYFRALFHFDSGDFNDARFMGFAEVDVTNPDGSVEKHHYHTTMGVGTYDTNVPCVGSFCHASPWWSPDNALHGRELEDDVYDTDGTTLLRQTKTQYALTCPPPGVSGSPSWKDSKDTDSGFPYTFSWDGQLVSELNNVDPVAVCDIQPSQVDSLTFDGAAAGPAQGGSAQTLYETLSADTLLTGARQASTTKPGSATAVPTQIGTATGWVELLAQGGTGTMAASEPAPSGHGYLWDATTLEGQQLAAGTWKPVQQLRTTSGSVTADVHLRVYRRGSDGAFHLLVESVQPGVSIGTSVLTETLPSVSGPATCFTTGDRLYYDVVLNVTSNSMGSSDSVRLNEAGSSTALTTPAMSSGCSVVPVPHSTTTYTYDTFGRETSSTTTTNGVGTGSPSTSATDIGYTWNDSVTATSSGATGTYLIDLPASVVTRSADGAQHLACQTATYDGQSFAQGQSNPSLTHGDLTSQQTETSCGTAANGYATSGDARTTFTYDQYGNAVATDDAGANAGLAGHTGCTLPGSTTAHSLCMTLDGTFGTLGATTQNALQQTMRHTYGATTDASGGFGLWPLSQTDPNGQTTSTTYDALGRTTSTTLPGEAAGLTTAATRYTAWCSGAAAQAPCLEIDQTQRQDSATTVTSRTFYDGLGRPVETRSPGPAGQDVVSYTYYDSSGRVVFQSVPHLVAAYTGSPGSAAFSVPDASQPGTTTTYTNLRVTAAKDALSHATTTTTSVACGVATGDSACYVATTTVDPASHQQATFADALGRQVYAITYNGDGSSASPYTAYATTATSYDLAGRTARVLHPDGVSVTSYTYDDAGQLVAMSDPDTGPRQYAYDVNGNVVQTTDARGAAGTTFTGYDGLNRPLWISTANDPASAFETFTYDGTAGGNQGVGALTGETFTNGVLSGSESYVYDARNQETAHTLTVGAAGYTLQQAYDDAGNVISRTYPDGEVIGATYAGGFLTAMQTAQGPTVTSILKQIGYDAAGHMTSATLGDGATYAAAYDALGHSTDVKLALAGATAFESQRAYNPSGTLKAETTTLPAGTDTQQFCYDAQDRLTWAGTGWTNACADQTIAVGTLGAANYTQSLTQDQLDRLASGPLGAYGYGDPAHLHAVTTAGSGYTASYDAAGNMTCRAATSATTCAGGSPTGAQLVYDVTDTLTHWQSGPAAPSQTADYLADGSGTRVAQQVTQNGVTTTTVYVDDVEDVTTTGAVTATTTYYSANGQQVAMAVNGVMSYLGSDGQDSVTVALDAGGSFQAAQLYQPYGAVRYSAGTLPTSYTYTGQRADATTGLSDYGARQSDPLIGQFTSADTVLDGLNRYAYAHDDPTTLTDPTGHAAGPPDGTHPPKAPKRASWVDIANAIAQGIMWGAGFAGAMTPVPDHIHQPIRPPGHEQPAPPGVGTQPGGALKNPPGISLNPGNSPGPTGQPAMPDDTDDGLETSPAGKKPRRIGPGGIIPGVRDIPTSVPGVYLPRMTITPPEAIAPPIPVIPPPIIIPPPPPVIPQPMPSFLPGPALSDPLAGINSWAQSTMSSAVNTWNSLPTWAQVGIGVAAVAVVAVVVVATLPEDIFAGAAGLATDAFGWGLGAAAGLWATASSFVSSVVTSVWNAVQPAWNAVSSFASNLNFGFCC